MQSAITTLDKEIAREERIVGIHPDGPITRAKITVRQAQVAFLLALVAVALLGIAFSPRGSNPLRLVTTALAVALLAYALEQDRHLRRLSVLTGDSHRINLAVVDALKHSGALRADRDLLFVRGAFEKRAYTIAAGLADVLLADVARVRIAGPSGEVPIAAVHMGAVSAPDDPEVAQHALRRGQPLQRTDRQGRTLLAVPVWYHDEPVAILEAISPAGVPFEPRDAALVEAYARGALAALRLP
jgi:GAF domain-containing protein